ncbi:Repressor ROX1 [Grifola frondosa]|uniref:Repressor ROX1 n=1 Tax=Grifola frondosa TaxID=5627 RepID=A0A1C7LUH1_GRIFR|nr:Repressor ROX1 [Grifola frondosa]
MYVISHSFHLRYLPAPSLPPESTLRPLAPAPFSLYRMPVARTKASKRKAAKDALTSGPPVDSFNSIAFAPNVTPGTFYDPPPPIAFAYESTLFPDSDDLSSSGRRSGHAKKRPEDHIPRPPNAFILFRTSFIRNRHVPAQVETNHSTLSKIIGITWKKMPPAEKSFWRGKAKLVEAEHKRRFPQYAFRPQHVKSEVTGKKGKTSKDKRKTREVGLKDMKRCTKIAELLVEGKKGDELDAAVQEFDRYHVPEVVTRFEAPITALNFRRSSSAPVPSSESSKSSLPRTPKKNRSASSQPESSSPYPSECFTPSSSLSDMDMESDFYSSPSSPFIPKSSTYSPSATNPSLNFDTFTFNPSTAMPLDVCDPLSDDQQSNFNMFSVASHEPYMHDDLFSPTPQGSYTPQSDIFPPRNLTINTNFNWTIVPSPFSNMGTPQAGSSLQSPCDPLSGMEDSIPSFDFGPASYEFLSPESSYSAPLDFHASPHVDMSFSDTDFTSTPRTDPPFYGKPGHEGPGFSPSFFADLPTYAT